MSTLGAASSPPDTRVGFGRGMRGVSLLEMDRKAASLWAGMTKSPLDLLTTWHSRCQPVLCFLNRW